MAKQHPWAGISHDFPGLSLSSRLVTVNRTVGTGWLVLSIGTLLQPHLRIVQKFQTRRTQDVPRPVLVSSAIHADHFGHGYPLTGTAFLFWLHFSLDQPDLDIVTTGHQIGHQPMLARLYVEALVATRFCRMRQGICGCQANFRRRSYEAECTYASDVSSAELIAGLEESICEADGVDFHSVTRGKVIPAGN